ncbi:hypothetical protein J4E85_000868 [Alternaria conjuncta]|uniref:uncharacterized protein n=1 Tax=Alternaria conjuncta TaxID=181017 RepID=UPI00222079EE|nr:uncharacterized protein J4E85_000868 [Alternaria conjuncta]KAI4938428.1 hypothetical protein J4E85_000868 [Alternaria conjuncta]
MPNIQNNAFKENRYHDTHKIPYPVVPRRSVHSMLRHIQGLHAETWKGCQVNYVRIWKHHGDEQKLRQYADAGWA